MAIAIEVSVSQSQVHVEDLYSTMKNNRHSILLGHGSDWTIVDVANDLREAMKKAAFWEGVLSKGGQNND